MNGQLAGARAKQITLGADHVADIEDLEQAKSEGQTASLRT